MDQFFAFENDTDQLVRLLQLLLVILAATSIILLGMTAFERFIKIQRNKKKVVYQEVADQLLFRLLFEDHSMEENLDRYQQEKFRGTLFKRIMIKSIVSLQHSYTGLYKEKLEAFFAQSDLVDYSLNKLASRHWYDVVEGIRDLSLMNFKPAHKHIRRLLDHKHKTIQKEAFIGLIKLQGLEAMVHHKDITLYLDDWTQITILYLVKTEHFQEPAELATVFEGKNDSVSLLAARLFDFYSSSRHIQLILELQQKIQSLVVKQELQQIVQRLQNSATS